MKAEKLNRDINQVIKSLNPENQAYMNKLKKYFSFTPAWVNRVKVLEVIYGLAVDLSQAQADGISAKEFFGNDPKQMADEITKNIPRENWWTCLGIFLPGIICFNFSYSDGIREVGMLEIKTWFMAAFLLLFYVTMLSYVQLAKRTIYPPKFSKTFWQLGTIFVYILGTAIMVWVLVKIKNVGIIKFSGQATLAVLLVIIVLSIIFTWVMKGIWFKISWLVVACFTLGNLLDYLAFYGVQAHLIDTFGWPLIFILIFGLLGYAIYVSYSKEKSSK